MQPLSKSTYLAHILRNESPLFYLSLYYFSRATTLDRMTTLNRMTTVRPHYFTVWQLSNLITSICYIFVLQYIKCAETMYLP